METENSLTAMAKTFNENVAYGMKWMQETMQTTFESYAPVKDSFIEANEKAIEQLNDRITTGMNFYTKFWSDMLDSYTPLNKKALKTKGIHETFKTPAITNNKKQANANSVGV